MEYTTYITVENDRWDNISRKAFGVPTKIKELKEDNPYECTKDLFKAGVILRVRILEEDETKEVIIPAPWKRLDLLEGK